MAIDLDLNAGKQYDRERSWRELGTAYLDAVAIYCRINLVRAAQHAFLTDNTQVPRHTPEHADAAT